MRIFQLGYLNPIKADFKISFILKVKVLTTNMVASGYYKCKNSDGKNESLKEKEVSEWRFHVKILYLLSLLIVQKFREINSNF